MSKRPNIECLDFFESKFRKVELEPTRTISGVTAEAQVVQMLEEDKSHDMDCKLTDQ